jgi:hypothetical protein
MTSTRPLGEHVKAWMHNHEQSYSDLASALRVSIDQLPGLAAEVVEITEVAPESEAEQSWPIPIPPLPGELLAISEWHGVPMDRLVNMVNGRIVTG